MIRSKEVETWPFVRVRYIPEIGGGLNFIINCRISSTNIKKNSCIVMAVSVTVVNDLKIRNFFRFFDSHQEVCFGAV